MALLEYRRVTDFNQLVKDINVEITDLFYVPVFDSFGDLGIGDGDPDKPGAIAGYMDGDECKLAIYNGDGTWSSVGGSPSPTRTPDPSLNFATTSADMESSHPTAAIGDIFYNVDGTDIYVATKIATGIWQIQQSGT